MNQVILILLLTSPAFLAITFNQEYSSPMSLRLRKDPLTNTTTTFSYLKTNLKISLTKTDNKDITADMNPDLGYNSILFGHKTTTTDSWGILCDSKTQQCNYDSTAPESTIYYWSKAITTKPATTLFRLGDSTDTPVGTGSNIKLTDMISTEWIEDSNTGVFGLSPTSDVWKYLFDQYSFNNNELSFSYQFSGKNDNKADLFESTKDNLFVGSKFTISDIIDADEKIQWIEGSESDFWTMKGVSLTISGQDKPIHVGEACISSASKATFLSNQFLPFSNIVNQQICGNDTCDGSANISKAPKIKVSINLGTGAKDFEFELDPKDYVYQINNKTKVSVQDISEVGGYACSANSQFGFGRMFFLKKNIVFKKKNNEALVGIGEKVDNFEDRSVSGILLAGCIGILLILCMLMFLRCSSGKDESGEQYHGEDGQYNIPVDGISAEREKDEEDQDEDEFSNY